MAAWVDGRNSGASPSRRVKNGWEIWQWTIPPIPLKLSIACRVHIGVNNRKLMNFRAQSLKE
jgi:hypothetical protein